MRKLWLACIAPALVSCQAGQDTDAAEAEVAAFHRDYDAGRFAAVFEKSGAQLKEITPRPQFIEFMTAVRQKLGAVESAQQTGWNVNYATQGSQITLTYETTFANGQGTETFVYDTAKPPRLLGYTVNSPVLIVR